MNRQSSEFANATLRGRGLLYVILLVVAAWTMFALTHELGHIVTGTMCGGTLVDAELRPWKLPYSFFNPDPRPLWTLWGGPLVGVLVPLLLAAVVRRRATWFVAWFCLVANGAYLAVGLLSGDSELDTTKLRKAGSGVIPIVAYCLLTIVPGYLGLRREWLVLWQSCRTSRLAQSRVAGSIANCPTDEPTPPQADDRV